MTVDDLERIEESLGISLPASYRERLLAFPIPAAVGNTDLAVWDDADRLIALNRELRRGLHRGMRPWPARFFAIGHPGDGNPHALDLEAGDAVWWVFHSDLDDRETYLEGGSFPPWADHYFATVRAEMADAGVDPEGRPAARAAIEARNAQGSRIGCVVAVVVAALIAWLKWG